MLLSLLEIYLILVQKNPQDDSFLYIQTAELQRQKDEWNAQQYRGAYSEYASSDEEDFVRKSKNFKLVEDFVARQLDRQKEVCCLTGYM